jgi:hypothetical protein
MRSAPDAASLTGPPDHFEPGRTRFEDGSGGYFDLPHRREGTHSSVSNNSSPLSIDIASAQTTTATALAALQYLPVPLLVLSSTKTVVLANEAMGRLFGINLQSLQDEDGELVSITEVLKGQTIGQLGIEILQHGSPMLISWEVRNLPLLKFAVQISLCMAKPAFQFSSWHRYLTRNELPTVTVSLQDVPAQLVLTDCRSFWTAWQQTLPRLQEKPRTNPVLMVVT